jgi:hypothetical protein
MRLPTPPWRVHRRKKGRKGTGCAALPAPFTETAALPDAPSHTTPIPSQHIPPPLLMLQDKEAVLQAAQQARDQTQKLLEVEQKAARELREELERQQASGTGGGGRGDGRASGRGGSSPAWAAAAAPAGRTAVVRSARAG